MCHIGQGHTIAARFVRIGLGAGVAVLVVVILRVDAAGISGVAVYDGEGGEGSRQLLL
jgi:hypothetical protein